MKEIDASFILQHFPEQTYRSAYGFAAVHLKLNFQPTGHTIDNNSSIATCVLALMQWSYCQSTNYRLVWGTKILVLRNVKKCHEENVYAGKLKLQHINMIHSNLGAETPQT